MKSYTHILLFVLIFIPLNTAFSIGNDELYKPFAEVMPAPKDGLQSIYNKIKYPDLAKKAGIEGKVYLLVYINENGDVDDIKVLKSLVGCDDAAIEAVKNTKFNPGKNNGVPIKVKLTLQIQFQLDRS